MRTTHSLVGSFALLVMLAGAGCARGAESTAQAAPPRVVTLEDEGDAPRTAKLSRGDTLVVVLAARLGTGFGWKATKIPDALASGGEPETLPSSDGGLDRQRFRFEAKTPGGGALVFELRRPWDQNAPPQRVVRVDVSVE